MKGLAESVIRFLVSEDGPTALEYAVMAVLVIVVCIAAIMGVGQSANTLFETARDNLS